MGSPGLGLGLGLGLSVTAATAGATSDDDALLAAAAELVALETARLAAEHARLAALRHAWDTQQAQRAGRK